MVNDIEPLTPVRHLISKIDDYEVHWTPGIGRGSEVWCHGRRIGKPVASYTRALHIAARYAADAREERNV